MFQSLIGRLKTFSPLFLQGAFLQFQSLIGRLKTGENQRSSRGYKRVFQSLIGRLKTDESYGYIW